MQTDYELLKIIVSLKNSDDEEAKELYKHILETGLTLETLQRILDYYDKIGDYDNKISFLEYLLKLDDSNAEIYSILGQTYKKINNFNKAKNYYDKAINLDPNNFIYYYNKGIIFYEEGNYYKALDCFRESAYCNKNVDLVYYNLGNTYIKLEDYYNAIKSFKMAIELNGKFSQAYFNLGVTYEKIKLPAEALKCYEQASIIEPKNYSYAWNKSLMLLKLKRYKEGFYEYESRLKKSNYKYILNGKRYSGENLAGKVLLVYTEQGFGDAFLFIRLIPHLKKAGCRILLFTHEKLIRLFKENNFADEYYDLKDIFDAKIYYDYYISLLSLPAVFNVSPFDKEFTGKYITVGSNENLENIKLEADKFNIGIAWKGNPEPKANRVRHTELRYFKALSEIKNVKLYSFQLNSKNELQDCGFDIVDLSSYINDFYDTAYLLTKIDLMISVDTGILHLAGTMGVNTLALLPNNLDWRWNDNFGVSDLYPSIKLIKQSLDYNWDSVFEQLIIEVKKIVDSKFSFNDCNDNNIEINEKQFVLLFNEGKFNEALELLNSLILKYPNNKRLINNRGLTYQNLGYFDKAILDYRNAIELDENYELARINLVSLLLELENFNECEKELELLKEKCGYNKESLFLTALFYHKIKKYDEAEKIYLKLRDEYDDNLIISINLGMLYNSIGLYLKAANIFIEASQKYPNSPELYFHLGNVYANYQEYERAINWYLKAISLNNKYLDAYLNLGNAYFNLRKFQEALILYNQLLGFGFVDYRIYQNIGIIYYELKKYNLAVEYYEKALVLENKSPDLFLAYAETLLMLGNYKKGWEYYKKRVYKDINLFPYINKIPNSKSFEKNSKIIITGEQGIGDNIMFARYLIPFAKEYNFTLLIRKDLYNFFRIVLKEYPIKVVTEENIINYDYVIPLLNLPELFLNTEYENPEFNYAKNIIKNESENSGDNNKITKIGICWKGKETPYHNRKRHMDIRKMLKVISDLEYSNVDFVNLQHELTDFEKELCDNFNIKSVVEGNEDIIETFNIISNLDLIITVDTSIAHIAGSLGKLTYLMLCFSPDWRWGYEGDKTDWYPTLKIFRQNEPDNWDNVLNNVSIELKNFLIKRDNKNVDR